MAFALELLRKSTLLLAFAFVEAVETLGDLQGPEGLQALRVLSRSEDAVVRDEVAETLHDLAERAQQH